MSKKELIKKLLQHELNLFRFSVYATFNEEGELKYALCLKGEKPYGYDIHLIDIGGIPETTYTYDCIDFMINNSVDDFLFKGARKACY
jgi:hypothetical protein